MGSPVSEEDMKFFLNNMFMDKSILPLPLMIRKFVSSKIASKRYKNSWLKYEKIGGSPLLSAMDKICSNLNLVLGNDFVVKCAYSYSNPLISNTLNEFKYMGVNNICVIPAYPFYSISTTGSIINDINKFIKKNKEINIKIIDEYFFDEYFVKFWQTLVENTVIRNNFTNPHLLFSAHSIPYFHIKNDKN